MKKVVAAVMLSAAVMCGLTACTQMPTERQNVTNLRPQLSFKFENEALASARVLVDGLDMGVIGSYRDGQAALQVLSGMHNVRVVSGGTTLVDEKIYAGDGVNRAILVK